MEFRFVHFYPDLMNLYGSYANVLVLRRLLERLGHRVRVRTISPGESVGSSGVTLSDADFLYLGAGTEHRQRFAMAALSRCADSVRSAANDGVTMLFAGNAMELCGTSVTPAENEHHDTFDALSLAEFSTLQRSRRIVGDVFGYMEAAEPDALYGIPVVGFMNKSGIITGVETPLLNALDMGFGNDRERAPEGFRKNHVFGSELTGPVLVKNPRLLERVAAAICTRRGAEIPEKWPVDEWAEKGYEVTVRELNARRVKK